METVVTEAVQIPGYRIDKPLGVGGMASVYLALQESLDREVALKVMSPSLSNNTEFTERFLKEGRLTAKLAHPNLVTVYDIGQHNNLYYLAAEYIPGGTLRDRMNLGMNLTEIIDVMRDVAMGLTYAHEKSVVHRDVKPGNVLFRANGTAVLADFGIAKAMNSNTMSTQAGNSIGTPHYMSPEQARADKVDGRSDIYSLGAMMYEMLVGAPPYESSDPFTIALMHVTHPLPILPQQFAWLQPILNKMMAKLASDRYATGDEFVAALDKLMAVAPEAQAIRDAQQTRKRSVNRPQPMAQLDPMTLAQAATASANANANASTESMRAAPAPVAPSGGGNKSILIAAVIAGGIAVAGIGYGIMKKDKPQTAAPTDPDVVVQQPADPVTTNPVTPDPGPANVTVYDGDTSSLIERAHQYVRDGIVDGSKLGQHLSYPAGDNATEIYQYVLSQDPDNVDAITGLQRIADFWEKRAQRAFDIGSVEGCRTLAENGLMADPTREKLKELATVTCVSK
ncbi:MAG: serine/threonine protein kinase [Ahniella sp.]|nr:serine/threonine protein kinase [Ahniella sp.]